MGGVSLGRGVDAVHWSEVGSGGEADSEICEYAREHGYAVLTNDLDFPQILAHTRETGPSVVLLRGAPLTPEVRGEAYGDLQFWATYGLWAVAASRGLMRWGSGTGPSELGLMVVALATPLGAAAAEIYRHRRIRGKALELLESGCDPAVLEECALSRGRTMLAVIGMLAVVELVGGR